jgi:hypothetical protein
MGLHNTSSLEKTFTFLHFIIRQFVGRAASGLPLTDKMFAALPPHFLPAEPLLKDSMYEDILPGFKDFPESFKSVLPYLLASLIHHQKFLSDTLP